jgi:hypothetical protein
MVPMKLLESNMAARSIASLSISFGLVNIPVRLYSATESAAAVKFNMLRSDGSRLKQQYVAETDGKVVPRADMVKGYEFEKDHFVMFSPDELKALECRRRLKTDPPCRLKSDPGMGPARWLPAVDNSTSLLVLS